jgi:asparagine synthase (glutamine-hydrolysing)
MPGIVGLITKLPKAVAEIQLVQMTAALCHEASYSVSTWIDEEAGIYVGAVSRQSGSSAKMPLQNETGEVTLMFAGEEYPEPGLSDALRRKGHAISDEHFSYLVHAYEENPKLLIELNGRFHGLLADRKRGTATLFVDRYGMNRLYYYDAKDAFYFSAEAKGILAVRPELRSVNPRGLGELIANGCVLENRTIFEGISVVPPGSGWIFKAGLIAEKSQYFRPQEWEDQESLDLETYYQTLKQVFSQNLPRYFKPNDRIGVSLTGGLDSRMIMAWQAAPPQSLPCYSFGGSFRDCQDVVIARQVANICGQSHQVINLGEEFLRNFRQYAERTIYLSDGCADVYRSPDLYANERASEIAPIRMTGNYGSEVLRGVRAFKPQAYTMGLFAPYMLEQIETARETYNRIIECHPLSFAVFRQAPWHHYGLLALEQTQLSLRSPYLDNDLVRTVFRAPRSALASNSECLRLIGDGNPELSRLRTDRGLGGSRGKFAAALTRAALEFSFKSEYAYDYGMPQSVARVDHMFSSLRLERLFLGRHKFSHFRIWYRDFLSQFVLETLLDPRSLARPYLDRKTVETVVVAHTKGRRNYTSEIHKLLTLEILHRIFIDAN